ncbi:single-stranded-DNA-specific exonuclease RecJ [Lachnospiraceae bacterium MD1]|uniref:Single-stranded-DNA-specific exonuclease RecJ n=1 Tax=Variimorphobacter saccharofermentans TaxID=2755051 RepID=A0A839K3F5_9FIRM|nr:single-stranded-DNA-specific exonuclease RecJ [Variimorphobacter saccharofermentans]MBB2183897.1 single-stranded-DNA-specific exonuclease RecJ [Variimorphobacter saccharofermentans]
MENWVIKNKKADFHQLMQQCGISEVLARCLVNKGYTDSEKITAFLNPKKENLYDPFLMKDMRKACDILTEKIHNHKCIRIIGDYDVDGVVATYVLYQTLTKLGAEVDYDIPDRIKDGYGINAAMVGAAIEDEVDTILTCDNGIAAIEQIAYAKDNGMTVIVTDHHDLVHNEDSGYLLPLADAIINPKQPDCTYPYPGLCGAAIAFKLSMALMTYFDVADKEAFLDELITYVAIATVCDVMDLVDENRIIVKSGLNLIKNTENKGLLALMDACGIDKEQLSAFHLGFVIGPCLNASGRLDTAKKGMDLLLACTKEEAVELAGEVRMLNDVRKEMTAEYTEKAIKMINESDMMKDKVLVVYLPDCHESIAGIIAGRVRERFNRPTIILTDAKECVKGSGRSIEQYNMVEELSKCRDLFLKMGGHPMAAGLSLLPENIDILRRALNENTNLTEEMLIPKVSIDVHLPLGYINESLIQELQRLEPFGKGNEKPVFAEKDLRIKSAFVMGKNACGLRFRLENQYGKEMEAIYFGDVNEFFSYICNTYGREEEERLKTGRGVNFKLTITYYPRINEYNGFRNLQLIIQNYR